MNSSTTKRQKLNIDRTFSESRRFQTKNIINYDIKDLVDTERNSGMYAYILDFDVKLSNGQNLQRDFVWSIDQKRQLILSILKNQKLPVFHIAVFKSSVDNPLDQSIFKIVDGKQRLSAIQQFYNNEFSIIVDECEYYFKDFDSASQAMFNSYSIDCNLRYEYNYKEGLMISDKDFIEWFYYVNFAGTTQDISHFEKLQTYVK